MALTCRRRRPVTTPAATLVDSDGRNRFEDGNAMRSPITGIFVA